jgi:hypothetical protein
MPTQKDLIHEMSVSTGTGNFATTAVNGKVQFGDGANGFGTGGTNVFDYYIASRDAAEWEHGTGHCAALGLLVRDTVLASSNAGALVNFSAGTKDITCDVPAAEQLRRSNNLSDLASAATARTNLGASSIGVSLFTAGSASAALALLIPSGTAMLFQQTAAPTGWTKQGAHNDKALRVVSGAAGSGGVQAFSTVFARTTTDAVALGVGNMPPHSHSLDNRMLTAFTGGSGLNTGIQAGTSYAIVGTLGDSGSSQSTGSQGSGSAFTAGMDIRVQYVDVIIATKD